MFFGGKIISDNVSLRGVGRQSAPVSQKGALIVLNTALLDSRASRQML